MSIFDNVNIREYNRYNKHIMIILIIFTNSNLIQSMENVIHFGHSSIATGAVALRSDCKALVNRVVIDCNIAWQYRAL